MNKLKVVFLDFDDIRNPLLGAGQAKATLEVGSRLSKMGYQVSVISSKFPGYRDGFYRGMWYKHIGVGTSNIKLNNAFFFLALPFAVLRLNADIILECFTAPISTCFSPLFTKIPVVAIPTSFEADRFSKMYHLPFDWIQRLGLARYKYFAPYTNHLDREMKKHNPSVISKIIPEGVGDEFFKIKNRGAKHILFLGRFDIGQKGIDLFLEAYAAVKDKIGYPVVIAGHGPDKAKIQELVKGFGLEGYVTIEGSIFGKKKEKMLSQSLFVAFPSRHEGFSLFSLEALASGLPLVAFDIPALSWAPESAVLKAKKFDVSDYAQKLLVASGKKTNASMRLNAREVAKQYRWDMVCQRFSKFFGEVLQIERKKREAKAVSRVGRFI